MTQAQAGQRVEETFRRFGSMINFIMLISGFVGLVFYLSNWKSDVEGGIRAAQAWQTSHEAYHRDRIKDTENIFGGINARLTANEKDRIEDRRTIDLLGQRVAGLEKAIDTVEANGAVTSAALNKLSGDMQVVKEILTRIEKKQGG